MTHRILLSISLILICLAVLLFIVPTPGSVRPITISQRQKFDESRYPIADYISAESTDPHEQLKRRSRAEKHNKSRWQVNPNGLSDTTVIVDNTDQTLPSLPFEQSPIVLIGQITDSKAYLSQDKSGIYSSFTVQVNELLKNSSKASLSSDSRIEVEREGGRVRFPSGRLHLYITDGLEMPQVSLRYVLFLSDAPGDDVFGIVSAYELKDGSVYALDNLKNQKVFDGADELTFLKNLRSKAPRQ